MNRAAVPFLMLCAAALLFIGAAQAQTGPKPATPPAGKTNSLLGKHNNSEPINFAADHWTADLNNKSFMYTGNVIVTQGDIRLHADTMKVLTDNGKAARTIQANGAVVVDSPATGTVTGDAGVYDVAAHTVLMTGKVVLTHGKDVMRGTKLTVNLDTGQATLGAQGAAQSNGRVQGTFSPTGGN
jgi:lipopolysaccharide export system protein LptA